MRTDELQVAVVGVGLMGADHVQRIAHRTRGAALAAVVDVDQQRATTAAVQAGGAGVFGSVTELIAAEAADAVILATPGAFHQPALLQLLEAGIPVMCEKPLTTSPASALEVVEAEVAGGRRLIQVGFMRRFDTGYRRLKELIETGTHGELLMLHHQHRNASTAEDFNDQMLIQDSVVHEFDAVRYFSREEIANVQIRIGRRTSKGSPAVHDPQLVTVQTSSGLLATVEIFVSAQIGYQVLTQATFENGVVSIGDSTQATVVSGGASSQVIDRTYHTRFVDAYDAEIQQWVDSILAGAPTGPSTWDGYAAAAVCEAGVTAQRSGEVTGVQLAPMPDFYR